MKKQDQKNTLKWAIVYDDGSIYSDQDGAWTEAPAYGVIGVVVPDPDHGRYLLARADYYVMHDGQVIGLDHEGLHDYIANVFGIAKIGRMVTHQKFEAIYSQMVDLDGFAKKTAYRPGEKRIKWPGEKRIK